MLKRIYKCLVVIVLLFGVVFSSYVMYDREYSKEAVYNRVHSIYDELWRKTGQNQDRLPLRIVEKDTINAYNDGSEIVIYTGLINSTKSWDEIALVLGHEIAHGTLDHLHMMQTPGYLNTPLDVSVLEGNADKMGAVYMMKAGYDICKGREMFKNWLINNGDYQGGNHPNYAYRYSELNINCE